MRKCKSVTLFPFNGQIILYACLVKNKREDINMIEQIRYRILMRQLRKEIARTVNEKQHTRYDEKIKTAVLTACKAYGSIV